MINLIKSGSLNKCTHIDLSGIYAMKEADMIQIVGEMVDFENCENLMGLHLNDLGINFNQYLTDEIKEMFLINEDDHKKIPNGDLHSAFRIHIDKVKGGLKYRK